MRGDRYHGGRGLLGTLFLLLVYLFDGSLMGVNVCLEEMILCFVVDHKPLLFKLPTPPYGTVRAEIRCGAASHVMCRR